MNKQKANTKRTNRRKQRVRKKVFGTAEKPRLAVYRSLRHMYAQIIDDDCGATLVSASTRVEKMDDKINHFGNCQAAVVVGQTIARKALELGIRKVCFDRRAYKYHGRVKALAQAARDTGLVL